MRASLDKFLADFCQQFVKFGLVNYRNTIDNYNVIETLFRFYFVPMGRLEIGARKYECMSLTF